MCQKPTPLRPTGGGFLQGAGGSGTLPSLTPQPPSPLGWSVWDSVMFLCRAGEHSLNYTPDHLLLQTITQIL